MLFGLLVLASSVGEYRQINVKKLEKTLSMALKTNLKNIFPEYANSDIVFIPIKAWEKIVEGHDLIIEGVIGDHKLKMHLHRSLKGKIVWENVEFEHKDLGADVLPVGEWHVEANVLNWPLMPIIASEVRTALKVQFDVKDIYLFRTQPVEGTNYHLIFKDSNHRLHSVIVFANIKNELAVRDHYDI